MTTFQTIYELFQETVLRSPAASCVEYGNEVLTYQEVNERANQLARRLNQLGAGPEKVVGIFMGRSPETIISMLGVWKSGAAYVPISTAYPSERIVHIIQEAQCGIVVTGGAYTEQLAGALSSAGISAESSPLHILSLDADWTEVSTESRQNLPTSNSSSDLAYIIYTSGSTGRPKGVMIEHKGIPNLVREQIIRFSLEPQDRVLQYASTSFDASVSEIFTTLIAGATLVLPPDDQLYVGSDLYQLLKEKRISVVTLVPTVLGGLPQRELPELKTLITAGEACTKKLIHYWAPKVNLQNAYGPSEVTVCATMHSCRPDDQVISLGSPIGGTAVYLLNSKLKPVEPGEIGELYVASVGIARGYVNNTELTEKHFIENPFQDGISDRLYRTGDLCLLVAEGVMEWIGRDDQQVKISGIRIELGELEFALREYTDIEEAVVTYNREDNYIGAYLKSTASVKPNITQIRNYLLEKFPSYMVPTRYLYVDEFPMLTSGKIDRHGLPSMKFVRPDLESEYVEPSSYLEKELAQIWCEVLKLDRVGIRDNFFELGGQSLMATQIVSRIRQLLGMEVPLHVIFASKPTVEQTAASLEQYQLEQLDSSELELLLAELEG